MRINDGINELWKNLFFEKGRRPKEVEKKLFETFGLTVSNISQHLKYCSTFLRKQNGLWIQKKRYEPRRNSKTKNELFKNFNIHPEIERVSRKLFENGHYPQSVFEAFKRVNNKVKEESKLVEDGKSLMMRAFNENNPTLKFNSMKTTTERDIQEGRKFLFAGSMLAIRNPKAHDEIKALDPLRTMRYICFASLLMEFLEEIKQ